MDKVSVFESSDFGEIRVMVINDQPWFVGSDIASALGYSNASKAVSAHVDEEDIDGILLTDLERFTQNGKSRTGLGLGLSLLRLRERHRPDGVSLDVEMMSVLSTLASIQD